MFQKTIVVIASVACFLLTSNASIPVAAGRESSRVVHPPVVYRQNRTLRNERANTVHLSTPWATSGRLVTTPAMRIAGRMRWAGNMSR